MDGIAVSVCPYAKKVKILPFLAMLLKEKHEEKKPIMTSMQLFRSQSE